MRLPVALVIDIEPDPRRIHEPDPDHWAGFAAMLAFVPRCRPAIAQPIALSAANAVQPLITQAGLR